MTFNELFLIGSRLHSAPGRIDLPEIDPKHDRSMVCGSLAFNKDIMAILDGFGLKEGANSDPAQYVVEKAFVG